MDRQQIGLKLALDQLGHSLNLSDFDQRLVLQKTVYLVQSAGVHLGYTFYWYLRGPYSSGLTRDAFALRTLLSQGTDELTDWKLDAPSLERLAKLRPMFQIHHSDRARYLELLASVHFLVRTRQATIDSIGELRDVLLRNDKDFVETEIRQAIDELRRYDLSPVAGSH